MRQPPDKYGIFNDRNSGSTQRANGTISGVHSTLYIKKLSIVRRMERFLDNGAIRVRSWYEPIACWLIQAASVSGELALVWDSTKVSAHHRLVLVGLAYRRRVIPLAWRWVRTSQGDSLTSTQIALLSYCAWFAARWGTRQLGR